MKAMSRLLLLLIPFLLVLGSCSTLRATVSAPDKPKSRESWLTPFHNQWDRETPSKRYAILRVPDFKRSNEDSLRFELRPSDHRSQIFTNHLAIANAEHWYGFSVYLPSDTPVEAVPLIFAEWKTSPKQNWDDLSAESVIRFQYENGEFSVLHENTKLSKIQTRFAGHWNDFLVQVKWSSALDGFFRVWLNQRLILEYKGRVNSAEGQNAFFKFGLNREETMRTYLIYFSEVREGFSSDEVTPP